MMSGFGVAALAALALTIYGMVVVWFVGSRRKGSEIDDVIRLIARAGLPGTIPDAIDDKTIDIKTRENLSLLQKLRRLLGVDAYEALYYPVAEWMVAAGAALIAVAIGLFVRFIFGVPILALYAAIPLLWVWLCRSFFGIFHSRRRNKLFLQLPEALDLIVRAARIGVATSEAVRSVGRDAPEPTATEFRKLSDAIAIGITIAEAMRTMAENNKIAEYRFLAIAVGLQASAGGSIGGTLEDVAQVIRSRVSIKVRGWALTGEARASAGVLTALPIFTTAAMSVIDTKYILQLFVTKSGLHYFGAAVVMILLGQFTMKGMVRRTLDRVR